MDIEKYKINLSIRLLVIALGVIAIVLAVLSHGVLYMVERHSADEANEASAKLAADNTARNIASLVTLLGQSLAGQAADPKLTGLIAQNDPVLIQLEEERITRATPNAWLIRLLPENLDAPDESRSPKMGFADLSMVRTAVTDTTQPSINLANSPNAHLAITKRLGNGGGVLHASWPLKVMEAAIVEQGACGIELSQESVKFAYHGSPACKETEPTDELPVKGTPWKIAYWKQPDFFSATPWFAGALGISLVLLGGLTYFLVRLFNTGIQQDSKSLLALVGDLMAGVHPADYSFKLTEFVFLATEVSRLRRITREVAPDYPELQQIAALNIVESHRDAFDDYQDLASQQIQSVAEPAASLPLVSEATAGIFRADDIRGIAGDTFTKELAYVIGLAIGSEMASRGEGRAIIGRDGRLSSAELSESLAQGLLDSGRSVINLGQTPTPLLYYATHVLETPSAVMITGGHNPADHNGLKIIIGGDALTGKAIQNLHQRVERRDFVSGSGTMDQYDVTAEYIERIVSDTQLGRNLKVVVDCGNGVAGLVAPELFRSLGCEVIELFCTVDGRFPSHDPNPSNPANLEALIAKVIENRADLGLAFDADGDSMGLIDSQGKIIWPDRLMMVFAADVLSREPGADILFDVKCSRHLPSQIVKNGGRPLMWKSGHGAIKAKMKESGAILAGEFSGHIYFQERWFGFDDGIYASARMIEILSNETGESAAVFAKLPDSINTPELIIPLEEGESGHLMQLIRTMADFNDARVTNIDGLRVDFLDGWGIVRAANSAPALSLRFEADNEKSLMHIQSQFKELLEQFKPDIVLPF